MKTQIADIYELAPIQQGLLFHALYSPHSGAYFDRNQLTVTGAFKSHAFKTAWQQVIARHPILRTSFHWELKKPVQVVHRQVELPWSEYDWRDRPADDRQTALSALLESDRQRGFDLTQAPLLRLTVIRLTEDTYHIIFSKHHILLDGWSRLTVFKEVFALYKSLVRDEPCPLPTPVPYRHYITWLRQQDRDRAEQFWRRTLQGFTTPTQLHLSRSTPHPSPPEQPHATQRVGLREAALYALARQHQLTLNTLVLAAWSLLLSRYSGETDVVFGVTSSGRSAELPHVEAIVGSFVNTLPMRVQVQPDASLLTWLQGLQARQVEMRQYEYSSLVQIQGWSDLPPGTPLFDTLVVFENYPVASLREPDETLQVVNFESENHNHYPLSLYAAGGRAPYLELSYDSNRFDEETIAQMLDYLQLLLDGIAAHPQHLAQLPKLTPAEQQQIAAWNQTDADYPQHCIHHGFEAQVSSTPEVIALTHRETPLTYRELNARANHLAVKLQQLGVTPEVRVGICLERSPAMVIALLGVLKAGGTYIPLDPAYPQQRLVYMIEDAPIGILLTQSHLLALFPHYSGQTLCLDSTEEPQPNIANLQVPLHPSNLAYIIYTSGSTGHPKGVQISHRAVVNFLHAHRHSPGLAQSDILLAVTSLSFDIAVLEIFLPLTVGAQIVLADREVAANGFRLAELLQRSQATVMQATPATWRMLLAAHWEPDSSLKILCGGESLAQDLADQLRSRCQVWNLYGPTEATIWATHQELVGQVTIGKAIANLQVYLLDAQQYPVPIGVPGELYIGGVGVARGYLNRPGLTAEKFLPDPFSNQPGTRLYRTGDRVRYRRDGSLEFLGRLDSQVKIRGFRIELGEIETQLARHPQLRETVVVTRKFQEEEQLVAYGISLTPSSPPEARELQQFLRSRLPEFMIPSRFVYLEALPLTPNGKVDRRSLPAPYLTASDVEPQTVPHTAVERQLAEIWRTLLNLEAISLTDNFFEIGGHSLLAIQLLTLVQQTFAVDVQLKYLFEMPTLAEQASFIADLRAGLPMPNGDSIDLEREAILDSAIIPTQQVASGEPTAIFLTGATGFLGAFLLYELLQQTDATIYCLVRAISLHEAHSKLRASLETYALWSSEFEPRIIPVLGDLSKPKLGLSGEQSHRLAEQVDVIYHSGALVNFVYSYSVLKAINVLGTQEVLRLACSKKTKPVHFISTFGVFATADLNKSAFIYEGDNPLYGDRLQSGYAQSKWVAEKLVRAAGERGLPICIYRPGRVTGDSRTGCGNPHDFISLTLKGCLQLGSLPKPDSERLIDMTPVDYVSRAIVYISRQPEALGKAFHLVNPHPIPVQELVDWLVEQSGQSLELLPYERWREQLLQSQQNVLYPMLPRFPTVAPSLDSNSDRLSPSLESRFDCQNTMTALQGTAISCPPANDKLLQTYFSFFVRSGFLESPLARLS
ncbi:MAG: amino acid adenylation domain-containing protein [Cyanophyceae cyanobacterium]